MSITLSRKDIVWSYYAQFFSIASGIITLPLILHLLSADEIGMNYLILTIGSIVSLFDFGFSPQFGRNLSYVFSGAQILKKEGIDVVNENEGINFRLLKTMILTAKYVYRRLGLIILIVMLTFGTLYIYHVTDGFSNVKNSLIIWVIYSFSTFFNIYFSYYSSLLTGKGLIMESRKAMIYSKLVYIALTFIFLILGMGLLGVTLANLIAPFVNRWFSYRFFFTDELKNNINEFKISKDEKIKLFHTIWYNAKKLGIITISASSLSYLATFIIGLFLNLSDVATYGIMIQLIGLISTIALTLFVTFFPRMSFNYIRNEMSEFKKYLSISILIFIVVFVIGSAVLIFWGPKVLQLIKSNTMLPDSSIILLCVFFTFLDKNQSLFSQVLLFDNEVIFLKASILTGVATIILIPFALYLQLGLLGVILAQGIPLLVYSAWKWPFIACKKYNIKFMDDIIISGIRDLKYMTLKFLYAYK